MLDVKSTFHKLIDELDDEKRELMNKMHTAKLDRMAMHLNGVFLKARKLFKLFSPDRCNRYDVICQKNSNMSLSVIERFG